MFVLVNMPGAEVTRPSLALGILTARLRALGVPTRTVYGNLMYFEELGPERHQELLESSPAEMVIEFVFSAAAFPDFTPDAEAFAELACRRDPRLAARSGGQLAAALRALRAGAPELVRRVADVVLALEPRAVGCTSMFQQHTASLALLREVKRRAPGVATLLGGANCESSMGATAHRMFPWVDYVVSGEADTLIEPLWWALDQYGREIPARAAPAGVFVPEHREVGYPQDASTGRPARAVVASMDEVPTPDYSDYFEQLRRSDFGRLIVPGLPFETSRGCWWGAKHHCTFCGLNGNGMAFRARSADRAIAEVRTLQQRYGVPRLEAVDNILSMDFLESVMPELARDVGGRTLFFETKANLRADHVMQLAAAGVRWIQPGIESLDTRILALMRKGTTASQNIQLLRDCAQHGVTVAWSTILGLPGEDDAWHAETARLVRALHHLPPGVVSALRFDRFSPYVERPGEWALALKPAAPYVHVYPLGAEELGALAYYFDRAGAGVALGDPALLRLGPGAERLRAGMLEWRAAHTRGATLRRDGAWVIDTRLDADAVPVALPDAIAGVLELSADGPRRGRLRERLIARGREVGEVEAAIDEGLARRWLVAVDGRLLNLVLSTPVREAAPDIQFPGGSVLQPELFD